MEAEFPWDFSILIAINNNMVASQIDLKTFAVLEVGFQPCFVLLLLIRFSLLLPLWGSVFNPCLVVHCFVSFQALLSS